MLANKGKLLTDQEVLGKWGERRCEQFLKKKGLKLLVHNFSCNCGEIDLIMVDSDGSIVFVEVKTRVNESFGPTESVVTTAKQARLSRTARYFLTTNHIDNRPFRFDVVIIILDGRRKERIRHYENAFPP